MNQLLAIGVAVLAFAPLFVNILLARHFLERRLLGWSVIIACSIAQAVIAMGAIEIVDYLVPYHPETARQSTPPGRS